MSERRSVVRYGADVSDSVVAPSTVVFAHAAPDDHLRIAALMGRARQAVAPDDEAARTCLEPTASWRSRKGAFEEVLRSARDTALTIVDIDALRPPLGPHSGLYFERERRWLYEALVQAADSSTWTLVRPSPRPDVTEDLLGLDVSEESAGAATDSDDEALTLALRQLSPACGSVARGLVSIGARRPRDVVSLVDAASGTTHVDDTILELAYGTLGRRHRLVAWKLATLRGPQHLNGSIGPFSYGAGDAIGQVDARDVETLERTGWLVRANDGSVLMHAAIRAFVARRATAALEHGQRDVHRWLGAHLPVRDLRDRLEQHHHAIVAGDVERAIATAVAYGSDLRLLAVERSQRGDYVEAAELFQTIVDRFDHEDAYAWEYLGYNLARSVGAGQVSVSVSVEERIERAYARAVGLEPHNSLYEGRLLGFRAERGADVRQPFDQLMGRLVHAGGGNAGWAAKPVFDGLKRGGREGEAKLLAQRWRTALRTSSELTQKHPELFGTDG